MGERAALSIGEGRAMPTSDATLNGALLHIAEQVSGLNECRNYPLAASTVHAVDEALRGIRHKAEPHSVLVAALLSSGWLR